MSANDWIKISIKYSGTCVKCKKKLESGHYGYWSRSSKSILHENCFDDLNLTSSKISITASADDGIESINDIDDGSMKTSDLQLKSGQQSISHDSKRTKKNESKIKCYICNNVIDLKDDLVNSLLIIADKFSYKINIFYCYDCLENFDDVIIEKYKKKFMSQI